MASASSRMSTRGWAVTLAGTGINLALGVLYTWSVIAKILTDPVKGWGMSAEAASIPYAVACGVFALMMVFAGRAQDRLGPRIVATIGGALIGAGMILSSFASKGNAALMIVGFGILGGTGIGLGYAAATPAAVKWFPASKKGLITGIVVAGFGLASVYTAPLTKALLGTFGINSTFLYLGIGFFVVTVVLAQLLNNPPVGYQPEESAHKKQADAAVIAKRQYDWHEMLKTPQFYLLWIMYAFVAFAGLMIIGHMAKIAAAQLPPVLEGGRPVIDAATGLPKKADLGFLLVAVLAIGNAIGRVAAGVISDRLGRPRTMLFVFLLQAAMMGVLAVSDSIALLLVAAAFVGFNYGANLTLFPAATNDYYGTKNFGVNYGLVFTAWGVGGVFGSIGAGRIVDATGSYAGAYGAAAVLCILAAAMSFIAKAPAEATVEEPRLAQRATT